MNDESKSKYLINFTEEFDICLDNIQEFFAEQGSEVLDWWYRKEDEIVDYIVSLLSQNPFVGLKVQNGAFKGLRRIIYGKSRHRMLNYIIYYDVKEIDGIIYVINILPSRSKRQRI